MSGIWHFLKKAPQKLYKREASDKAPSPTECFAVRFLLWENVYRIQVSKKNYKVVPFLAASMSA